MQKLLEKVDAVEEKIRQLLHKAEQLERENDFLLKKNIALKKEFNQYKDKIEVLQHAIEALEANSITDKEAFKHKIKLLAEEVGVCIDMVNA